MAKYRRSFSCEVLTPDGSVCEDRAVSVILPAVDGQIGILGGRSPILVMVGVGLLSLQPIDGGRREFFVEGGFAEMSGETLTVLAERCRLIDRIDPEEAWEELQKAKRMPARTDAELATRDWALDVARKKFRMIQAHRRRFITPDETHADAVADADWD